MTDAEREACEALEACVARGEVPEHWTDPARAPWWVCEGCGGSGFPRRPFGGAPSLAPCECVRDRGDDEFGYRRLPPSVAAVYAAARVGARGLLSAEHLADLIAPACRIVWASSDDSGGVLALFAGMTRGFKGAAFGAALSLADLGVYVSPAQPLRRRIYRGQETYVELWVEKQALAGVLEPLGHEFHVTFMANKGYSSQSAMRDAAMRIKRRVSTMTTATVKARPVVLYLGDHDPSGKDMPRDIALRLKTFGVERLSVDVIALTTPQVKEYDPPPNPAKITDPRAKGYIAEFGDKSWELDALPPRDLQQLVRRAIESRLDRVKWRSVIEEEERQKRLLSRAVKGMDVVDAKAQPVEGRWCSHPDCNARVYPGDYCPGCDEYVCVDHRTRVVEGADESHDVWCHWEDVDADSDGEDGDESE